MKGLKIQGKSISKVLAELRKEDAINPNFKQNKKGNTLTVPLKENYNLNKIPKESTLVEEDFIQKEIPLNFKEEAEKILSVEEKPMLKTAYDIIGTIAILEIDEILDKKAKQIGEILLKCNPNITTVARKAGAHEGELRIQKYEILAGENTLTTIHKENGCNLFITLDEVYYSPRSSTERKRIYEKVKKDENVLVMFSGAAPFVCTIAKNTEAKSVTGIELNETGHELGCKSVIKNKLKNVDLIQGDVRQICPALKEKNIFFDRIIMPLPKTAEEFLPEAFMVAKNNATIHLYDFVDEREFPENVIEKIEKYAKKENIAYEILDSVKCGQFSPYIYRVCVDFKINKN